MNEGIALAAQVAVALVVGQDQDDVGTVLRRDPGRCASRNSAMIRWRILHLSVTVERDRLRHLSTFQHSWKNNYGAPWEGGHSCPRLHLSPSSTPTRNRGLQTPTLISLSKNLRGLGQNLELTQVELLVEIPAEKAGCLLIGDGNGVQMTQAVHSPGESETAKTTRVPTPRRSGRPPDCECRYSARWMRRVPCRLYQPVGRGHQLGGSECRAVALPGGPAVVRTEPKGAG